MKPVAKLLGREILSIDADGTLVATATAHVRILPAKR
jgi:hypothetical protein